MTRLLEILQRCGEWLSRLARSVVARFTRAPSAGERSPMENRLEVRARFWSEVREGRREAETRCEKRDR